MLCRKEVKRQKLCALCGPPPATSSEHSSPTPRRSVHGAWSASSPCRRAAVPRTWSTDISMPLANTSAGDHGRPARWSLETRSRGRRGTGAKRTVNGLPRTRRERWQGRQYKKSEDVLAA